jgi:hypothetical protein
MTKTNKNLWICIGITSIVYYYGLFIYFQSTKEHPVNILIGIPRWVDIICMLILAKYLIPDKEKDINYSTNILVAFAASGILGYTISVPVAIIAYIVVHKLTFLFQYYFLD